MTFYHVVQSFTGARFRNPKQATATMVLYIVLFAE